jgi:hypothetical protein
MRFWVILSRIMQVSAYSGNGGVSFMLNIPSSGGAARPALLNEARRLMRTLHVAKGTEEAYIGWIYRYLRFHRDL